MDAVATLLALMFFGFITIVLLVIGVKTLRIVPQATVMLIERLGSFHHVAQNGLNILWPLPVARRREPRGNICNLF